MEDHAAKRRPLGDSALWKAYGRHRYAILFYSLLLMLLAIPIASAFPFLEKAIKLLLSACLLAAVMPNATKHSRYMLLASMSVVIAASFIVERDDIPINSGFGAALTGFIGVVAAVAAARFAIESKRVDSETIYASLGSYLLAGLFFGQLYFALETIWPGSISGPDDLSQNDAIYFSFVTLASLGYGDFLPKSGMARGLAMFEVIGGQLYLASLVARLIGLFPANRSAK